MSIPKPCLAWLDDDADFMQLCTSILLRKDYDVRPYHSLTDLLADLPTTCTDAIVLSGRMTKGRVREKIEGIRAHLNGKSIPALLITTHPKEVPTPDEVGVDRVLRKPFEFWELEEVIRSLVGIGKAMPSLEL